MYKYIYKHHLSIHFRFKFWSPQLQSLCRFIVDWRCLHWPRWCRRCLVCWSWIWCLELWLLLGVRIRLVPRLLLWEIALTAVIHFILLHIVHILLETLTLWIEVVPVSTAHIIIAPITMYVGPLIILGAIIVLLRIEIVLLSISIIHVHWLIVNLLLYVTTIIRLKRIFMHLTINIL